MLRFGIGMGGVAGALGTTAYLAGTAADIVLCRLEAQVAAHGKGAPGVAVTTPRTSNSSTLASVSASSPAWVWQEEEEAPLRRSDSGDSALLGALPSESGTHRHVRSPARLVAPARRRAPLSAEDCESMTDINDDTANDWMCSVRDFSQSGPSQSGALGAPAGSPIPAPRRSLHRRSVSEDSASSFVTSASSMRRRCELNSEPAMPWWGGSLPDPALQVDMVARFLNDVLEEGNSSALADLCTESFRFSERNVDFGKATATFEGVGLEEFADCLAQAPPLPGRAALESVVTEGHKVIVHFDGARGSCSDGSADHLLIFHLDPSSYRISQLVTCRA